MKARWFFCLVVCFALLSFSAQRSTGFQFHYFFETSLTQGGGGGLYYTGSPRYKRYDCRICHVNPPGVIKVDLWTEPVDIFQSGYKPGETYTVHLTLEENTLGIPNSLLSTNNFCAEVLDGSGRNAGTFDLGFKWDQFTRLIDPVVLSPDETVVLSGFFDKDLHWQWFWTAPEPGSSSLVFYVGFVDGDGDLKAFGDDVAILRMGSWELSP